MKKGGVGAYFSPDNPYPTQPPSFLLPVCSIKNPQRRHGEAHRRCGLFRREQKYGLSGATKNPPSERERSRSARPLLNVRCPIERLNGVSKIVQRLKVQMNGVGAVTTEQRPARTVGAPI